MIDFSKRRLLTWVPPTVVFVALPQHGYCSIPPVPVTKVKIPSKCSGDPLEGSAVITILSDSIDLVVNKITHSNVDGHEIILPSLPAMVFTSSGIDIEWKGPSGDAQLCLPADNINFEIEFSYADSSGKGKYDFDLISVLTQ